MTGLLLAIALAAVTPKEQLRFRYVFEQQTDSSCGLSALASLLSLYRGMRTSEEDLAVQYIRDSDTRQVPDDLTVSFEDLSLILKNIGIASSGFWMDYGQMLEALLDHAPVLVHFDHPKGHFALVLGGGPDRTIVADPSLGLTIISSAVFLRRWSGAVLILAPSGGRNETLAAALSFADSRQRGLELWASRRIWR